MTRRISTSRFLFRAIKHCRLALSMILATSLLLGGSAQWHSVAARTSSTTQTQQQNLNLTAAQGKLEEGIALQKQGTAEALRAALARYEEALALWRNGGDGYKEAITLDKIGETFDSLGEKQKAADAFNAALKGLQTHGGRIGKASQLVYIGRVYVKLRDFPNALDAFNQARLLFQTTGDSAGEAMTLSGLGSIHYRLGDAGKALDSYGKSRELWKSLKRPREEAAILSNIGALSLSLGDRRKALDQYREAASLFQTAGDRRAQAAARFEMGRIHFGDGQWKEARENLTEAANLSGETSDRQNAAFALDLIGQSHFRAGQPSGALGVYKQALKLWRELKNPIEEANTLDHFGLAHTSILRATGKSPAIPESPNLNNRLPQMSSHQRDALDAFDQAMKLWRTLGRHCNEADTCSYLALVYDAAGEGKLASSQRNEAYRLRKEHKCASNALGATLTNKEKIAIQERELVRLRNERNRAGEADRLIQIGWLHHLEGDEPKAIQYTSEAQSLARKLGDRRREAIALNNLGMIYDASGERPKAVDALESALKLFRKLRTPSEEANTLNNLGELHRRMGSHEKALECYQQSLPLARSAKDPLREGFSLNNIGLIHHTHGAWRKALEFYQQAVPLFRQAGAKDQEANTIENIGRIHQTQGDPQQSLVSLKQAIPLWQEAGNRDRLAYAHENAGAAYSLLGELREALDHYRRAQLIWNTLGKQRREAAALSSVARQYDLLGRKQDALDAYERAAEIWRALGLPRAEAAALGAIGWIYDSLGDRRKAADYRNRAEALRASPQAGGDPEGVLDERSRDELVSLQQTLALLRSAGDSLGEARTLNRIGSLYFTAGESRQAIECHQQSLAIWRVKGNWREAALTHNSLALAHMSLGEKQKATAAFGQAADLFRDAGDKRQEARSRSRLADAYRSSGEAGQSLKAYRRTIALFEEAGERRDAVVPLEHLGAIHESRGEMQNALECYVKALAIWREMGARVREAEMLDRIGGIHEHAKEVLRARDSYDQARRQWQAAGDRVREASALYKLACIDRDQNHLSDARSEIESALNLIESVRARVISSDLRSAYLATNHRYYELYIDLLMQLHKQRPTDGFNGLALQISERARARSLLDLLTEGGVDIRKGVAPELLEQQRAVQQRLHAGAAKQTDLLVGTHTREEWAAVEKEIEEATAQLEKVESQIRQSSPQYVALTQPEPLSLARIQREVLDADTLLLEYALGEKRSYLWAVTQTGLVSYELPGRAEIETAVERVYNLFTSPGNSRNGSSEKTRALREVTVREAVSPAATELSRMLLSPAADQLGDKRLVIVADGALHKLPFNALPDPNAFFMAAPHSDAPPTKNKPANQARKRAGNLPDGRARKLSQPSAVSESPTPIWQPLVVNHEIVNLPSASTLSVLRSELANRKPATKPVAVFADPVFSATDSRIQTKAQQSGKPADSPAEPGASAGKLVEGAAGRPREDGFKRLCFTRSEAEQILALTENMGENLGAFGFEANRQMVMSGQLSQYRYIHFATHGLADEAHPGLSTIVLSLFDEQGARQDGYLRAGEIYNLNLAAELVVLSACETGLGKQIKGEGVVSLTRGFMYAGAARVVVSLWSVDDEATADLMATFYRKLLKERRSPAAALRAAQIEMWKTGKWSAPYYWAAFTLQGEWR